MLVPRAVVERMALAAGPRTANSVQLVWGFDTGLCADGERPLAVEGVDVGDGPRVLDHAIGRDAVVLVGSVEQAEAAGHNLATHRQPVRHEVVTHVLGTIRHLCVWAAQRGGWLPE